MNIEEILTKVGCKVNDMAFTRPAFAQKVVDHLRPQFRDGDTFLDPCAGMGAFYDALPEPKQYCEIIEGKDFLTWEGNADWCFANFPWSSKAFRKMSRRAYERCNNVVSLSRLHDGIGSSSRIDDAWDHGHNLREVILVDWEHAGFVAEGFALAVFHHQRNYEGGTRWADWRAVKRQRVNLN